ncbi:MAG: LLM class flavin-dependent oxidoreductase [Acidimicrobiales bacterium]
MHFSYCPWGATIEEFVAASAAAEAAGYERVWANELHRSPFVQLAPTATATTTVGIGTAVALAFVRSPLTTALAALDLDELSGGRFVLGLGSGVARLNEDWHHVPFGKPVPHLRETVTLVRKFVAGAHLGERIVFDGDYESADLRGFERPFPPVRDRIPIYLAAVGPALTALAGEVGDGWIAHELCSPHYVGSVALPKLETGLRRARRHRGDLQVVASACCVVDDDRAAAKRAGAQLVAFYASVKTYEAFFELHGFGAQAAEIREHFRRGDAAAMADSCPADMVDAFLFAGTADDVRAALTAYEGIADEVKLSPPTHVVPEAVTRSSQQALLELLA